MRPDLFLALAVWVAAPVPNLFWYAGALAIFAIDIILDRFREEVIL